MKFLRLQRKKALVFFLFQDDIGGQQNQPGRRLRWSFNRNQINKVIIDEFKSNFFCCSWSIDRRLFFNESHFRENPRRPFLFLCSTKIRILLFFSLFGWGALWIEAGCAVRQMGHGFKSLSNSLSCNVKGKTVKKFRTVWLNTLVLRKRITQELIIEVKFSNCLTLTILGSICAAYIRSCHSDPSHTQKPSLSVLCMYPRLLHQPLSAITSVWFSRLCAFGVLDKHKKLCNHFMNSSRVKLKAIQW